MDNELLAIDTSIADLFINGRFDGSIRNHWIFGKINEGDVLFEMPSAGCTENILMTYKQAIESLNNFQPCNKRLFDSIYPDIYTIRKEKIPVYLIAGAPSPYDAMCREDKNGRLNVIFDIVRIAEYVKTKDDVKNTIENLITHELTHVFLHSDYPYEKYSGCFKDKLKYIVFDEGMAHFLSLSENTLEFDFERHNEKFTAAIIKLKEAFEADAENHEKMLTEADTGSFWNKFGAIAGIYGIYKFISENENPYSMFLKLYKKGPDFLHEYIMTAFG